MAVAVHAVVACAVLVCLQHAVSFAAAAAGAGAGAGGGLGPACDTQAFAATVLPDFVASCVDVEGDDDDQCPMDCHTALSALMKPDAASCMAQLVHAPETFRGKGVFADTELQKLKTKGLPDFEASIRLEGRGEVALTRTFLARTFLTAVAMCNSELTSLNGAACGNARLEVYTATTVPALLSACTQKNALVVRPPICTPDCSHAYFNVRSHACFSRYFTTLDTAAANRTALQLLDPRLARMHSTAAVSRASSMPDKQAQATRDIVRNAARLCSPPDRSTFLNISSCSADDLEAYMKLSVQPFHAECSANVSNADPSQRFCTAVCDSMLQQVLWEPACLGLWSSHEASKLRSGAGSSSELITLTRAIQVCAIAREVSYSYEAQVTVVDDSPVYALARGSTSHPAVKAMFFMLLSFLVLVTGLTAWQQRHRCLRRGSVRYQRVQQRDTV